MNYAFEGFDHEFGRRRGSGMGPFRRTAHGSAPFHMWVPTDADGRASAEGEGRRGRGGHGRRDRSARAEGGRGDRAGHGAPFEQGRDSVSGGSGPRDFRSGGFGPNAGFGRGRGRGGRGRRGDVRAAILLLLEARPMHGYELIQQIAEKSKGTWRPSPGSVYPALAQLEDEGLVSIDKIAGRKTAALTAAGKQHVEERRSDLGSPWDEVADSVGVDARDLRSLIGQLMGATGQVSAVGTPQQIDRAAEVLGEARRALYRILAEDAQDDRGDADGQRDELEGDVAGT